ncbi:MAG: hypothetical protein FWD29_09110, partial [Micrococcales bacterium]|nr:hypothetical protein [Micrococcales bacterium]
FDSEHVFHHRARQWFDQVIDSGWASCPITQAGFVRVISSPRYPAGVTTTQAIHLITEATASPHHQFWPADLPATALTLDPGRVLGPAQVTDAYLLALAVANDGRFVTFDQRIVLAAVPRAGPANLLVL